MKAYFAASFEIFQGSSDIVIVNFNYRVIKLHRRLALRIDRSYQQPYRQMRASSRNHRGEVHKYASLAYPKVRTTNSAPCGVLIRVYKSLSATSFIVRNDSAKKPGQDKIRLPAIPVLHHITISSPDFVLLIFMSRAHRQGRRKKRY